MKETQGSDTDQWPVVSVLEKFGKMFHQSFLLIACFQPERQN